ncbi:MAG TPA: hypothetical protein VIH84_04660 [Candidatus Methylomirabilis sp.]
MMDRSELEKQTITKLRELCMATYPEIQGVSGMKKDEVIEAIIAEEIRRGLRPKTDARSPKGETATRLKAQIRTLKGQRDKALTERDGHGLGEARRAIKRLKRQLRKLREAS